MCKRQRDSACVSNGDFSPLTRYSRNLSQVFGSKHVALSSATSGFEAVLSLTYEAKRDGDPSGASRVMFHSSNASRGFRFARWEAHDLPFVERRLCELEMPTARIQLLALHHVKLNAYLAIVMSHQVPRRPIAPHQTNA
jgi:hypothetical protein